METKYLLSNRNAQLLQKINQIAALTTKSNSNRVNDFDFGQRPVFLLAPMSYTGMQHGRQLAARLKNVVAAVDDQTLESEIHGAPRWTSQEFLQRIQKYPDAIGIDFSCSPRGQDFVKKLCESAGIEKFSVSDPEPPVIENLENRTLIFMSPLSFLAGMHAKNIAVQNGNVIASIADNSDLAMIDGVPRYGSGRLKDIAKENQNILAIDFSCTPKERGLAEKICKQAGIELVDACLAIAHYGLHSVYEPARIYRQRTLSRLNDFLQLADRFEDEFSKFTLYSNLLFRLTYDRIYLQLIWSTPENEYFSSHGDASTFQVGSREHFCDCGAFQGPIVEKFLNATGHQYASISAFEPDTINFKKLQEISSSAHNFQGFNKAVSNKRDVLRFKQTGTVSSHASPDGDIIVNTTRLDDELETLTLLKLDIEGYEAKALEGASRLIKTQRPRIAACVYHYALDLLDVFEKIDQLAEDYHFRLRQHSAAYYYDLVLYASPVPGSEPPEWAK